MRIAIVGSREFSDQSLVVHTVRDVFKPHDILISGGARGVDTWAEETLPTLNAELAVLGCSPVEKRIYPACWERYGKRAGFIRNQLIIEDSDMVIAFWDGKSKGTQSSIELAIKAGKPINIYIRKNNG